MTEPRQRSASTWFKKGQSGNPSGRPRKPPVVQQPSVLDVILEREVIVTSGGVRRTLTVAEALQLQTFQEGLAGGRMAIKTVLRWFVKRAEAAAALRPARKFVPVTRKREFADPTNADAALEILGIATRRTDRDRPMERADLLLEPWAVQHALSRRTGSLLQKEDCREIERATRHPAMLRWPQSLT